MNERDKWIMAAVLALAALYLFKWQALYLYAVAAILYFFSRKSRR